jgi:hypothetical protein
VISGTPTASGTASLTIQVKDAACNTATKALSISIAGAGPQPLAINGSISQNATNGGTYSSTAQASGGTLPYTWSVSAGQLPPGLTLRGSTGNISGTPTTNGQYIFTLNVVDSGSTQQSARAAYTITVSASNLDQYGGFTTMPSLNPSTGMFRTEKFGNKWLFVDPANNAFFMIGMYVLDQDQSTDELGSSYYVRTAAKYGDNGPTWGTAQLKRVQSWGYNTVAPYGSAYVLPTTTTSGWNTPDKTNPVKLPFIGLLRPAYYGMKNANNWSPQPIKNMLFSVTSYYTGYNTSNGVADYYDNNLATYFTNELNNDSYTQAIKSSPYKQYMIGMNVDDSDEMYGFGAGPDFPAIGYNNAHLGWLVLTMSPLQTANPNKGFAYSDATIYSKTALHDQLAAQYGTIAALNAAWGSNYTTFDSSGKTISGEAIASGDGSALTFSKALGSSQVGAFSLQILVAGQPVAGDTGKGAIWGPNVTGAINYTTGALGFTFSSGYAPANGAAITANYVQNGWGIGTGLMDEDGRPAHQGWVGTDYTFMKDVNAMLKSDLDNYLYQIAAHYFSMSKTAIQNWMPGTLYLGPDSLGTWGQPSNSNVLKAAGQYVDVMAIGGGWPLTQPMINYIYTYYGDKPFYYGEFRTANPDSAFYLHAASVPQTDYATQSARGQNYYSVVTTYPNLAYSANGSRPYVGVLWWQYLDNWGERNNWGVVSLSDNAYDGHEPVTGSAGVGVRSVPCTPPLETYFCGGEVRSYGDVITSVTRAHQQVMQAVQH